MRGWRVWRQILCLRCCDYKICVSLLDKSCTENREEEDGITVGELGGDNKVKGWFAEEEEEETLHENG